ncbi:MAG: insulinase family protein, partial [Gemmatimonadota bacterium]|nr:insulinase family protein [Gemmatimonadota bacterium]
RSTRIILVHRPGSVQSNILVGNLAVRPIEDGTYHAAEVANKVLGGGADARLFMILREEKGWTYGSYSGLTTRKDGGYFRASAEVRTPVTDSSLVELMHQVRRVRVEAIPDSEMVAAKGYLVGSYPLTIQTPQQIASQVASAILLDRGIDFVRTYGQQVDAVTARQAMAAARLVYRPDSAVVVVVGDGQALFDKLAAIAPVEIIDVNGKPLTPADLTPTATALELDLSQIVSRRDSMQMSAQGMPVGYLVREVTRANGSATYTEDMSIAAFGMTQNLELTLDLEPLEMGMVQQTVEFRGQVAETHLQYGAGRVKGTAQSPEPTGTIKTLEIDTTLVEGTVDDNTLTMLIPALPLAEGAAFTVNVFESSEGSAKPYTLTVLGTESVTVPAGTFDTFKVESSGGAQPFVFYVTRETPRRLVKIEIVGQPVSFELAN